MLPLLHPLKRGWYSLLFKSKKTSIARSAYRRASSSFIQVKGVHNSLTEVRRDVHLSLNAKGVFTLLVEFPCRCCASLWSLCADVNGSSRYNWNFQIMDVGIGPHLPANLLTVRAWVRYPIRATKSTAQSSKSFKLRASAATNSKQAQDDLIPVDALQAAWASCSDHEGWYPFRIYGEVAIPLPLKRMIAIPYGEED